jgi:predicted nucleic acid-binding protein
LYLLDTNVVSELRKPRPHGAVVAWVDRTADEDLHISAVTLGELQAGVEITREQDPKKAGEIEAWIDLVAQTWNVLPVDLPARRVHIGRAPRATLSALAWFLEMSNDIASARPHLLATCWEKRVA